MTRRAGREKAHGRPWPCPLELFVLRRAGTDRHPLACSVSSLLRYIKNITVILKYRVTLCHTLPHKAGKEKSVGVFLPHLMGKCETKCYSFLKG